MFSPIKLSLPKSSQGQNLTGNSRHVRDLAADLHANIQQWNDLHLQGLIYLQSITQEKQNRNYSEELQDMCDKLENICNGLDGIVKNFDQIRHQLKTITAFHKDKDKLFITWPINKFGDVADAIYIGYYEEAKLKRNVLENVAHNHIKSWKMFHLATWVHQPALPEKLIILLESLLIEVGHR